MKIDVSSARTLSEARKAETVVVSMTPFEAVELLRNLQSPPGRLDPDNPYFKIMQLLKEAGA